jgi:hypothetical protein
MLLLTQHIYARPTFVRSREKNELHGRYAGIHLKRQVEGNA